MTGVVALMARADGVAERRVTHCCGLHRPERGEASQCMCCLECVSNATLSQYPADVLLIAAQWDRADRARMRSVYRRVEHALAVEAMWDSERDEFRHLSDALAHAVLSLSRPYPPVQGELT